MSSRFRKRLKKINHLEPDEIRDLFMRENIKGHRKLPCECPVANYLRGSDYVKVAVNELVATAYKDIAPLRHNEVDKHWINEGVRAFVKKFDAGEYPELELDDDGY